MTAKFEKEEEEKPKNLDSLRFSETKKLLSRICKSLGFRLFRHQYFSPHQHYWCLAADNDDGIVVFLEDHNRDEFQTAKDLLRGILNARTFKLRNIYSFEDSIIQNPLYSLDLSALQIKLDLLLA